MHRVYVAWNATEARKFLDVLTAHRIRGKVIEDREFPVRGELHDSETEAEVWIDDPEAVARARELALDYESRRRTTSTSGHGADD